MGEPTKQESIKNFISKKIEALDEKTQDDKETSRSKAWRAKLRRGIGKTPGALPDIWGITFSGAPESWYGKENKPSKEEYAIHTALTLYALHRQGKDDSMNTAEKYFSLGGATALLINEDEEKFDAVKRRLDTVATSNDFSELAHHARGIIQLLKASKNNIRLNYPQFAYDLYRFQFPEGADSVRRQWGEDFYRKLKQKGDDDSK